MDETFILDFEDDDPVLEQLSRLSDYHDITPSIVVERAVASEMGGYGLSTFNDTMEIRSMDDYFVAAGVLRPRKP
jgi:hypothetical protein